MNEIYFYLQNEIMLIVSNLCVVFKMCNKNYKLQNVSLPCECWNTRTVCMIFKLAVMLMRSHCRFWGTSLLHVCIYALRSGVYMRVSQSSETGHSQTFQNEGAARGAQGGAGGADWDSKWQLSIDLCTKYNFIWGKRGGRVSAPGGQSFCQGAVAPHPLTTPLQ